MYDIADNRYSVNELKKSTNIWAFLKSCRDALAMMDPLLEKDKEGYLKIAI